MNSYICESIGTNIIEVFGRLELVIFSEFFRVFEINLEPHADSLSIGGLALGCLFLTKTSRKANPSITLLTDVSLIIQSGLLYANKSGSGSSVHSLVKYDTVNSGSLWGWGQKCTSPKYNVLILIC